MATPTQLINWIYIMSKHGFLVIFALITSLFAKPSFANNTTTVFYDTYRYKETNAANVVSVSNKTLTDGFFESVYADVTYKAWDTNNETMNKSGLSGTVVGFYHLGDDKQFFASTQLQVANANLFPKSTLYQEVSYKMGEQKNILLGVGVGIQSYHQEKNDVFVKAGPVYYFEGGAVGYKYGQYKDSGSTLNALFANYHINDKLSFDGTYNFGKGYWGFTEHDGSAQSHVTYDDIKLKLNYKLNNELTVQGSLGKIKMFDKKNNQNFLNANQIGAGLSYAW